MFVLFVKSLGHYPVKLAFSYWIMPIYCSQASLLFAFLLFPIDMFYIRIFVRPFFFLADFHYVKVINF